VPGVLVVEVAKRSEARHGALDVAVVDHDVPEYLARVEHLEPAESPVVLVRREPAVGVLELQDNVHRVLEPLLADTFDSPVLHRRLDAF